MCYKSVRIMLIAVVGHIHKLLPCLRSIRQDKLVGVEVFSSVTLGMCGPVSG